MRTLNDEEYFTTHDLAEFWGYANAKGVRTVFQKFRAAGIDYPKPDFPASANGPALWKKSRLGELNTFYNKYRNSHPYKMGQRDGQ